MAASWLKRARRRRGWTQVEAAARLGISQPYLSLLENGRRPLPAPLLLRLQRHVEVPPTELPVGARGAHATAQQLAEALGALGYPGFAHLKRGARWHPAQVVVTALEQSSLEARVAEAVPWVLLNYPNLSWDWLVEQAKLRDLQNRLGFVVTLARELGERRGDRATAASLTRLEQQLERARYVREDTLGRDSMTGAERRWLQDRRSPEARHWNLLTDLVTENLPYA